MKKETKHNEIDIDKERREEKGKDEGREEGRKEGGGWLKKSMEDEKRSGKNCF